MSDGKLDERHNPWTIWANAHDHGQGVSECHVSTDDSRISMTLETNMGDDYCDTYAARLMRKINASQGDS